MALLYPSSIADDSEGTIEIELHGDTKKVFYTPKRTIEYDLMKIPNQRWHLMDLNFMADSLIMYPFKFESDNMITNKYPFLHDITLSGFKFDKVESADELIGLLTELPPAFVQDYNYGLGLKREYGYIVDALEEMGIFHLVITKDQNSFIEESNRLYSLKFSEFDEIRKALNRTAATARAVASTVKQGSAYNYLAFFTQKHTQYPQKPIRVKASLITKLISQTLDKLYSEDSRDAVSAIRQTTMKLIKDQPEEIIKLKNDLELVSLEQLIDRFEEALGKNHREEYWQKLFNENPFILTMAFGYPVIKISDQASVGGRKFSGAGDKIVDFLVKNSHSNNVALFEIKTPSAKLLNKKAYRDGVFVPSQELSGAVNQILDQKYKLERSILHLKDNSKIYDLESYAIHCVLVIGLSLSESDQTKSFEIFRGNSKSIAIVTFDEVLSKLKQLHKFLLASEND